jgi:hypothetical protein
MNGVPVEASRWSRRKWTYVIAAVLLGQALVIGLVGHREMTASGPPAFDLAIGMAASQSSSSEAPPADPTAFALPSWKGFSREGWLAFERPEFKPVDWTEPPEWLRVEPEDLGNSLHDFILSNTIPPLLIASKPLPALLGRENLAGNVPLRDNSDVAIEGELAGWNIATTARLPSWRSSDLLTNSVVHAIVDQQGRTVAATLLAGSGLAEADALALRTSQEARFRPRPSRGSRGESEFRSGTLVFRWHTLPATNAPGIIPLP